MQASNETLERKVRGLELQVPLLVFTIANQNIELTVFIVALTF